MSELIQFPASIPVPLGGYLACALTGLAPEQRQLVFHLSDTVALVCKKHGIELYEPRKQTDPVFHPDVPDSEVFLTDRQRVLCSDIVVHLCHYPSTGSGEELDFAYNALVPIVLVSHSDTRVSRMVSGIPALKLEIRYREPETLREQLDHGLREIRPILEERKLAFSEYDSNMVGRRIRHLREGLNLTRDDIASSIPTLTVENLRMIEESPDRISNPSLVLLRRVATVLKTTVADLVEPDLNERLIAGLQMWIAGRAAARGDRASDRDLRRLLKNVLKRIIDNLEE